MNDQNPSVIDGASRKVIDYAFHPDAEVARAEASWLQAIEDRLGHEIINSRWNAVTATKDRYEARLRRRG